MPLIGEKVRNTREKLVAANPVARKSAITGMLLKLVAEQILVTSLWPTMTVADGLGHMVEQLDAVNAGDIPQVAGLTRELRQIHSGLRGDRTALTEQMRAVSQTAPQPLVMDVSLNAEVVLPEAVVHEAEAAASALVRLSAFPFGFPQWKDFHVRFRERYGAGAVIPVQELVQQDAGLGLPAGYLGSHHKRMPRQLTERDENLLTLVQRTVMDGSDEIVLTEAAIRDLAVGDPAEMLVPPRAEIAFQVHATSLEKLERGKLRIAVTGAPRTASSMVGRFADLLDDDERDCLVRNYATSPTVSADAVLAQLSFPPRRHHSENVIRLPQLLPHVISVSEHRNPGDNVIRPDDLGVTADARQLYLMQLSTGQRIEPVVLHALEASVQTPPLVRFLAEIATGRSAVYGKFDWGAASRLPCLPRVRYGRAVLSPARWLLSARDLPPRSAPAFTWDAALDTWRTRLRAPKVVILCEADLRLPLDLSQPLHRALLRSRLDRTAGPLELREAPGPRTYGWLGRAHELLIPLNRATAAPPAQPRRNTLPAVCQTAQLPGQSRWLYARIYGHPDRQDEILTEHLQSLFSTWEGPLPLWWFRRFHSLSRPYLDQHLRLYVRLPAPEEYEPAAARLGDWAQRLRAEGLLPQVELGTYQPETGRYGHGAAMAAAEEVFAADSTAALAEISAASRTGVAIEAIAAASLVDLAVSFTGSLVEGTQWLIDQGQEQAVVDRRVRDVALRLADPDNDWAQLRAALGSPGLVPTWEERRVALVAYREQLAAQADQLPVLRSLLHMHHVRAIGVDPERERIGRVLARAAALRWLHAREGRR